jgi:hypothetical protein
MRLRGARSTKKVQFPGMHASLKPSLSPGYQLLVGRTGGAGEAIQPASNAPTCPRILRGVQSINPRGVINYVEFRLETGVRSTSGGRYAHNEASSMSTTWLKISDRSLLAFECGVPQSSGRDERSSKATHNQFGESAGLSRLEWDHQSPFGHFISQ